MTRLVLTAALAAAELFAVPAFAQDPPPAPLGLTLGGGLGYGTAFDGSGARFAFVGTMAITRNRFTVAAHGTYAEALDIFRSPTRHDVVGAVLVGPSWRSEQAVGRVLAGPSYTSRVLHGERIFVERDCGFGGCIGGGGDRFERVERRGVGVMGRAGYLVFPFRGVPVGAELEAGVNLSAAGLTASFVPALVVRLEP